MDYSNSEIQTSFQNYLGSNVGLYVQSHLSRTAKNATKFMIAFCDLCLIESHYEATRAQKKFIKDLFLALPVTNAAASNKAKIDSGRAEFLEILSYF